MKSSPGIVRIFALDAGMMGSFCSEEFVAKPLFVGCQRCDYRDLCEVEEKGAE